jgi:hypothetical protein
MRLRDIHRTTIMEGGNAFKDDAGKVLTRRISKSDIEPTMSWLEKVTGLPLIGNALGSVGKKESSGDLDIAVDETAISKDELYRKLIEWIKSQGIPNDQIINSKSFKSGWVDRSGVSVHFRVPIKGNQKNGFVQTDFMFTDDPSWMKFSMFSAGDDSEFSGADRNLLMSSLAKSLPGDLKYSWQKGLIKRSTSEPISKDPDQIASVLLGTNKKKSDLDSVETIMSAIASDTKRLNYLRDLTRKLDNAEDKKPGDAKLDKEEAYRIRAALELVK